MSYLTIYKASAGSGKTFTLAAKYTAYLLSSDGTGGHTRLLAVTFTNKATGEMKERILEKLYSIAHGTDPNDGFLKKVKDYLAPDASKLPLEELRKRAAARLNEMVHDYDHFAVQTIDSFFQSLLSNLAHELGLAANFCVELNDKDVISRAVDNIMRRIAELPEAGDGTGDTEEVRHVRALRRWVSEFISSLIEEENRWKIADDLKGFARQLFKDAYVSNEAELREKLEDSQLLRAYEQQLRSMETGEREKMLALAQEIHDLIMERGGCGSDTEANYAAVFRTNVKSFVVYVREALAGNLSQKMVNAVWKYVNKGGDIADKLKAYEEQREPACILVNSLRLSRTNINKLRLLGEIAREVDAINDEENHFMLAKTPILFNKLSDTDAPFVMERAGNRFEHVMIDEFQDTSHMQWGNFDRLLLNNISQGNECLLVGDVKQAIYRWRGGDWRMFDRIAALPTSTTHSLDTNFRSARVIVEFNNSVFTQAPVKLGAPWPLDAKQNCNKREGGYVRVCMNKEALFDDVAEQVRELLTVQHISLSQITMLLRNNDDADGLIDHFRQHCPDIPLVSNEAFLLGSSRAVQRLMAALRYLRDVGSKAKDDISMAYLEKTGGIPPAFIARRVALARKPLYELCEELITLFGLDGERGEEPFLFTFLDEVVAWMEENPSSLREFIRFWESTLAAKSIPGGEVEGIRIMSIHKSKGLAFHTVLVPFCNWATEKDRNTEILWCRPDRAPFNTLPVLPIPLQKGMEQSIYKADYEAEHEAQRIENLNLLYVAFTRAQQNLLVWGIAREKTAKNVAELLMATLRQMEGSDEQNIRKADSVEVEPGDGKKADVTTFTYGSMTPVASAKESQAEAPNPFCYTLEEEPVAFTHGQYTPRFRQSGKAQEFMAEAQNAADAAQRETNALEGVLLHDALSRTVCEADISAALSAMLREGLVDAAWVERHRPFLEERVASPQAREWFDPHWQVFNEQAIICPHPDRPLFTTRRPDRVITDGQRTLVIDFKFARPSDSHVRQVEQYVRLLGEMGYPRVEGRIWYVYRNEVVNV